VVLEQIVVLLVDLSLGLIYVLVLLTKLEIMAPSWAISGAPTHLIFAPTWERCVVLDQTLEISIFPFIFDVAIITSLAILLLVKD